MNKKQPIQFKTGDEISRFLDKQKNEVFMMLYEAAASKYWFDKQEREFVKEYNRLLKQLFKLVK